MKMNAFLSFLSIFLVLIISSCSSYKNVPYLQNAENFKSQTNSLYDAKIMPKDLVTISVSTTNPEAALPFNLTVPAVNGSTTSLYSQPTLQQYLVDNNGNIEFPVLGRIKIGGLTKNETEALIIDKLKPYLKETPIVTVKMTNYKIAVIGEVSRPGSFVINNEKVNLFEALAMAGDMTIYGMRNNMKLIRENDKGEKEIVTLNLNDANIINSPYYYLQQNDVLYVTPNKTKAKNSDIGNSTSLWFSATSILVSVAGLLVNILR